MPTPCVQIGTTGACNLKCGFCFRQKGAPEQGVMGMDLFCRIIDANPAKEYALMLFGEPLLDPELLERLAYIKVSRPDSTTLIHTNGVLLTEPMSLSLKEAGLSRLVVSCHGLYETHDRDQPGAPFAEIAANILVAHQVGLNVVVLSTSADPADYAEINNFWKAHGVAVMNKPRYRWGDKGIKPVRPDDACTMMLGWRTFDVDGTMLACAYDWGRGNVLGRFPEKTWEQAMEGLRVEALPACAGCDRSLYLGAMLRGGMLK